MEIDLKKKLAKNWFKILQEIICKNVEEIERKKNIFKKKKWSRGNKQGGGEFRIFEKGNVFDKVGVNFSEVYGIFPKNFRKKIPGTNKKGEFWACGISVVMHMKTHMFQQCILTRDIFLHLMDGLGVAWMLLLALRTKN